MHRPCLTGARAYPYGPRALGAGSSAVEHVTFNHVVAGSIPARLTNRLDRTKSRPPFRTTERRRVRHRPTKRRWAAPTSTLERPRAEGSAIPVLLSDAPVTAGGTRARRTFPHRRRYIASRRIRLRSTPRRRPRANDTERRAPTPATRVELSGSNEGTVHLLVQTIRGLARRGRHEHAQRLRVVIADFGRQGAFIMVDPIPVGEESLVNTFTVGNQYECAVAALADWGDWWSPGRPGDKRAATPTSISKGTIATAIRSTRRHESTHAFPTCRRHRPSPGSPTVVGW